MPKIKIDIKRRMIDIGRTRYRLLKIDLEPWRDYMCPVCEKGFSKAPTYFFNSYAIHNECVSSNAYVKWADAQFEEQENGS